MARRPSTRIPRSPSWAHLPLLHFGEPPRHPPVPQRGIPRSRGSAARASGEPVWRGGGGWESWVFANTLSTGCGVSMELKENEPLVEVEA